MNNATYLLLWYLLVDDFVNKMNKAPTVGNIIKDEMIGKFVWKQIAGSVIDRLGPDGISKVIKNFSARAVKFQSGYIYQYAFIMLLGFSVLLTLLILV